jgi:hypothetical protein
VTLRANPSSGELTVSLDGDGASIRAFFQHLPVVTATDGPRDDDNGDDDNGDDGDHRTTPAAARAAKNKVARVRVDARKLSICLHFQQNHHYPAHRAVLCLLENEMVVVHVDLRPPALGFQTYYVPVHYLSPDGDEDDSGGG